MPEPEPPSSPPDEPLFRIAQTGGPALVAGPIFGREVATFYGHMAQAVWPEHSHRQLEIFVIFESGICDLEWSSPDGIAGNRRMVENQVCLIAPDYKHSGVWHQSANFVLLHVEPHFVGELVGPTFGDVVVHDFGNLARKDRLLWETAENFRVLCAEPHSRPKLYSESLGTIFASRVLNAHFGLGNAKPHRQCLSPKQLASVTSYIETHIKQPIPVQDLAHEASLSMYHFIRLFKQTTGLSPHQYVVRRRIEKAYELLRSGNYRVAEAAHEAGFCDQSHLDRYFRRQFGFSPKMLIRQRNEQL